ncbi:hypothetical protein AO373_0691 [Moraxella catarrhalis]|nr:hypothetical protein AO379_0827 [Moraxella catarrhalis]OAV08792.1 hypothetical protein AO378_1583 [Moraxella catarrhalis]OAV09014.1 hypothetical protein AO377_1357 [Moraxella catarrhalis]OAV14756.1 hypothetical protein AO375_0967 [Moraxella catarrhalis]OAV19082.1 hypothetical protein AO373_0691 [Moraxella catarrhalis]
MVLASVILLLMTGMMGFLLGMSIKKWLFYDKSHDLTNTS